MEVAHTEQSELIKLKPFDIQKAKLQQLAKDYGQLVVTNDTYEDAKKARKTIRDERFAIQGILKENKGVLNKMKDMQESKAEELIAIIQPTEDSLDAGIKEIENRKEQEKARKEKEAQEKLNARIATLFQNEMKFDGSNYVLGNHSISAVQIKVFSDQEFTDFVEDVKVEHLKIAAEKQKAEQELLQKEAELEEQRKAQEAERVRLEAEAKKAREEAEAALKEQQRVAKEAQDKLDAERKAFEEEKRKAQEEIDRKNQAIEAEKEAERLKKIEEEEELFLTRTEELKKAGYVKMTDYFIHSFPKEIGTITKQEVVGLSLHDFALLTEAAKVVNQEEELKLEKARLSKQEALRPDKEKLVLLALSLDEIKYPKLENENAARIVDDAMKMILGAQEFINKSIEKL